MTLSPETTIRIRTLLWALLVVLFLVGATLLASASPLILLGVFLLGAAVAAAGGWIVRRLRRRAAPPRKALAKTALAGGLLATGLVALPVYWLVLQPALNPLAVPRVTLSDGNREVVFQGMVHIGSAPFYRTVAYDLVRAREAGYALYFEGISHGTPEAEAWFNAAMDTGGSLNDQYSKLAGFCGLHFQNDFIDFLILDEAKSPSHTLGADVSVTEMYEEWQRLVARRPELAQELERRHSKTDGGASFGPERLVDALSGLGRRQHAFVAAVCRGVFTRVLNGAEQPDVMNAVVLDFRNRKLAEHVSADPARNVYLVYGSGHFPGFFRELRQRNPAWKIEGVTWSTAIQAPEDAAGRLGVGNDALAPAPR